MRAFHKFTVQQSKSTLTRMAFTLRQVVNVCMKCPDSFDVLQQIDFGEETGPRTVVSGLVNYIPIEQMQDKWLVGVVGFRRASSARFH